MILQTLKRWLILVAVIGTIIAGSYWIQKFQVKRLARSVADQADSAAAAGDFAKAEMLYDQHLQVVPDDYEIQIKYADTLLKVAPTPARQLAALEIYTAINNRFPGREDVRRKNMQLKIAMGRYEDDGAEADLKILLASPANSTDGNLLFLLGRCYEEGKVDLKAKELFEAAIKYNAPQKIEAHQRLATLLRQSDRINDPKAADKVIDDMVQSAPQNYLVYLARGRYRREFKLPNSQSDFQEALALADDKPEIYLELARIAEAERGTTEAKKILENGLQKLPAAPELYVAEAELEQRSGRIEQAIEVLERGLKSNATDKIQMRWLLANILASRGDTGKLRLQIEELKMSGISPVALQFLNSHYYLNAADYHKARQALMSLDSVSGLRPDLKCRINNLLARCYSHLGEPGMQRESYVRALRASPQDMQSRQGLIDCMLKQGEIDEVIREYRAIVKTTPRYNLALAQQLINRNLRRPVGQRDWNEVHTAIDAAQKVFPDAPDPSILRAEAYVAQEKRGLAREEVAKAKARFPKSAAIRCAQANLLAMDKQFPEAQAVLDQAQKDLGDCVELRLQRAKLAVARGGPQVAGDLNALAQNVDVFPKADRRKVLAGLAFEFVRLQDLEGASRVWAQLVEQEPNDLDLRINYLDLVFQTANNEEIAKTIQKIEEIEGSEGSLGPLCQVQYMIWQAGRAIEKDPQEARLLRAKARARLNDLTARRSDWSAIPAAMAQLEQQELRQGGLTEREIYEKEESVIRSYRRAIDLGQRSSAIVRETVKLLFKHKRGSDALDLVNSIPIAAQLASDLGRQALSFAVENRDFQRAEEIARKSVAAKPAEFQERVMLVRILLDRGRHEEAETVIRDGIALAGTDPERWVVLVQFLVLTKQQAKAAQAIEDARVILPPAQAPLALAQCCTQVGRSYEGVDEAEKKRWYAQARGWYERGIADHPDDLNMVRRLTEFLVQTKQMAAVESQLDAILKRGSNAQNRELVAWARRTLALALASSSDPQRVRRARAILEEPGPNGQPTKVLDDPADLRTLARVLNMQRTAPDRKRAIEIMESLVAKNLASNDDRSFLASLEEASGNWPKALEIYRDLNLKTKSPRDLESLGRRSLFLAEFTKSLLRNHKAGNDQELAELQDLVDELAQRQPDALETLNLRVEVYRAGNQIDKAVQLIEATSHAPNLAPVGLKTLAVLAEKIDRAALAEELYRQYAALPNVQDGNGLLALYLSRTGRLKEALDIYEPAWAQARDGDGLASACVQILNNAKPAADRAQVDRVSAWLEKALDRKKDSTFLLVTLANFRERQNRYDDAKALYQRVINQVPRTTAAPGNANIILATSYNNLAWLTALKDGEGKDALVDINRAIELVGPNPDFLDTRGVIHLGLNQTREAIDDLQAAVNSARSPSKLFHLAQAYYQANDKEKAKQVLKEAKERGLDGESVGPSGLHALEQAAYQKLLREL